MKNKHVTITAIGHRRTPNFISVKIRAVSMVYKIWMRQGKKCEGAQMANLCNICFALFLTERNVGIVGSKEVVIKKVGADSVFLRRRNPMVAVNLIR